MDKFFDMRVLDPAMGSGHFLVEAVDFLTERLLKFLSEFPINPVALALEQTRRGLLESRAEQRVPVDPSQLTDTHMLRRHVLKRCIYGVDLNPMAVELAKVSLWLDVCTPGVPLSFLDHHLRPGNSLVGLSVSALDEAAAEMVRVEKTRPAIEAMLRISRLTDASASESAVLYETVREGLSGFRRALDRLVAQDFGIPEAQELAAQKRPFHWDLEFPEVFFDATETDLDGVHSFRSKQQGTGRESFPDLGHELSSFAPRKNALSRSERRP